MSFRIDPKTRARLKRMTPAQRKVIRDEMISDVINMLEKVIEEPT
jgi:hypothetical protein